ncbi:MAG TPA: phosphate acyltransferase PlsX [Gammaproteobacteria bacterium]|nr:phosphate acyltransferase PlsX [Gammaproteobacteria bacterium]
MSDNKRIAIDAMGGEGGVDVTVPASVRALQENPELELVLVGDEQRMSPLLHDAEQESLSRFRVIHSDQAITNADKPRNVLRSGRRSSMFLATELVKQGEVGAMVSAGNTGALLMVGRHLLKTLDGIQKPAIVATIPGAMNQSYLLDVGANPECDRQQLFEFAVMGSVLAESLNGESVSVALLNIGAEEYKGTNEVQQAGKMLEDCDAVNYIGFVEANDLFDGAADVVVCDGFVGNVVLKTTESVASMISTWLKELFRKSPIRILGYLLSRGVFREVRRKMDPSCHGGAPLLGANGVVIIGHGSSNREAAYNGVRVACEAVSHDVNHLIEDALHEINRVTEPGDGE